MGDFTLTNLLIVAAVAVVCPLIPALVPKIAIPSPVLEIIAGILLGPAVLGWVTIDEPVAIIALLGLAFLLFLAGQGVDVRKLRGNSIKLAVIGLAATFVLALGTAYLFDAVNVSGAPLLVAIVLSSTSLGLVAPLLSNSGRMNGRFGQLVLAAATLSDVACIMLLSALFSGDSSNAGTTVLLLVCLVLLGILVALGLFELRRWNRLQAAFKRLHGTTAHVRVRGAFLLMLAFAALAQSLGLEVILGAFVAGVVLRFIRPEPAEGEPDPDHFEEKLQTAGYAIFIPVFFVSTGIQFDLVALTKTPEALLAVPLFLLAILFTRGVPALLYRREIGVHEARAAGLLQSTTLPMVVTATQIGVGLGVLSQATAAGLVTAGLLTVIIFPAVALGILKRADLPT